MSTSKHHSWATPALAAAALLCSACALSLPAGRRAPAAFQWGDGMRYDAGTRQLPIEFPPVDVPANLGYDDGGLTTSMRTIVPFDGWLHGYTVEVVDSSGAVLGTNLLHHMNIFVPNQRELFSPIMLHVVAAGMETAPVRLPNSIGYAVRLGDPLLLTAMLHNPTGTAQTALRVRVRLAVTAAPAWERPVTAYPFHLQVTQPGERAEFDVPVGYSVQQREAVPAISGRIYGLGGHLHRYGESLTLEDVTANRVLWSVRAVTDADGNIVSVPTRRFRRGVRIEAGRVYRITSVYNNTSGSMIPDGGMGAIGGLFVASGGASWPSVDVNDPTYQKDFAMRFGAGAAEHHGHGVPR